MLTTELMVSLQFRSCSDIALGKDDDKTPLLICYIRTSLLNPPPISAPAQVEENILVGQTFPRKFEQLRHSRIPAVACSSHDTLVDVRAVLQ